MAGAILVAGTLVVAFLVHRHPGPDALDQWIFSAVGPAPHSSLLIHVADLGAVPVAVGGSALAAVATAWIVAVPGWLRVPVLVVGAGLVAWTSVAVIALRWHYPSDALAGGAFGVGVVLLLDGILHGAGARR